MKNGSIYPFALYVVKHVFTYVIHQRKILANSRYMIPTPLFCVCCQGKDNICRGMVAIATMSLLVQCYERVNWLVILHFYCTIRTLLILLFYEILTKCQLKQKICQMVVSTRCQYWNSTNWRDPWANGWSKNYESGEIPFSHLFDLKSGKGVKFWKNISGGGGPMYPLLVHQIKALKLRWFFNLSNCPSQFPGMVPTYFHHIKEKK